MRSLILALAVLSAPAFADTTACRSGRCLVVRTDGTQSVLVGGPRNVTIVTAQEHAETLAATGAFVHCNRRGHGFEGIGFSPVSPDDACRRCCFWGQRRVREIGTAFCPHRRGWVAVVRYE